MTATPLPWRPLLDGELAARATRAIDDIATALAMLSPTTDPSLLQWAHNLSSGTAGWALFHAYRAGSWPDRGDDERAMQLISLALDAVPEARMNVSLYHGVAGVAWMVEHVGKYFYDLGDIDPLVHVDGYLLAQVDRTRLEEPIDLMAGIIGQGVYALERMPRASAAALLSAVVSALEDSATRTEQGVSWFTPPELLGPDVAMAPTGYFNLGLAHGVPGVVSFLARCIAANVEVERSRRLLESATNWLLAQRGSAANHRDAFPGFVMRDRALSPKRSGWCYGDLGIACVLELAARITATPAWATAAREIALAIAAHPIDVLAFDDAGLCHGACGTGHMFNRLFQATGEPALGTAARNCFEHALTMRRDGVGIGGFQAFDPEAPGGWADAHGFLSGAAGIGLTLIAAVTDQVPTWDAVSLIGDP